MASKKIKAASIPKKAPAILKGSAAPAKATETKAAEAAPAKAADAAKPADASKPADAAKPADATPAKAESGEAAGAAPKNYSRGEGQKPVTQAYKDNWNLIFGKGAKKSSNKKKKR